MTKRKMLSGFIAFIPVFCMLFSSAGAETNEQRKFDNAMSELSLGNYEKAAEIFDSLDAFEQASYWAMYSRDMLETQRHNYYKAYQIFTFLNDFQDSKLRLQ